MNNIDLLKYSGVWYEIGRVINQRYVYQDKCLGAIAKYKYYFDHLDVTNYCLADGEVIDVIQGYAKPKSDSTLLIQFDNGMPAQDYIILATDYINYSLVGSSDKSIFWILSRHKSMKSMDLQYLIDIAEACGYDSKYFKLSHVY